MSNPRDPVALRAAHVFFAALFAFSVVVQYNDPDPIQWMAIYGAALASCVFALQGRLPVRFPALVAGIAVLWASGIAFGLHGNLFSAGYYTHWEMKNGVEEEARECMGLVLVASWCGVIALRGRLARRAAVAASPLVSSR